MPAPIQQPKHLASAGFGVARPAPAILAVATKAVIVLRMTSSKMLRNHSPEHFGLTADRDATYRWTLRRSRRQSLREQPEYDRDNQGGRRGSENEDASTLISVHNSSSARRAEQSGAPLTRSQGDLFHGPTPPALRCREVEG